MYTPAEIKLFKKLNTPAKLQDFLDSIPQNFEVNAETYYSPRTVLRKKTAHCFEGACFAAAVLQYHGKRPWLLDLRVMKGRGDVDHVVALFKVGKFWGAISKTNHNCLRWRDPIYTSVRELVLSYFHEYFDDFGRKNLREFAGPVDLGQFNSRHWQTSVDELDFLVDFLDKYRHEKILTPEQARALRKADAIEIAAGKLTNWRRVGSKAKKNKF